MLRLSAIVAVAAAATAGVGWTLTGPPQAGMSAHGGSAARPACAHSILVGGIPTDVETSSEAVWVATGLAGIVRVDPSTNEVVARIRPGGAVTRLARGLGAIWALDLFGERLLRIDPGTNRVERSTHVDPLPSAVAVGHGLVWVASQLESTVAGINPKTGQVVKLARFARGELWPGGLAVSHDGVWVVTAAGNEVSVFDPATMTFRYRLRVPGARTLVATGREAWVGVAGGSRLRRIRDGRLVHPVLGVRSDGYGPSLAAADRVWVAEGDALVEVDPVTGAGHRTRLPRGTEAGPIAVAGDPWTVDAKRGALLRVGTCKRGPTEEAPQ